jgi:hypothetical protein
MTSGFHDVLVACSIVLVAASVIALRAINSRRRVPCVELVPEPDVAAEAT